jgi:hypothetical protein
MERLRTTLQKIAESQQKQLVVAKLQHSILKPIAGLGGKPERILKTGKIQGK